MNRLFQTRSSVARTALVLAVLGMSLGGHLQAAQTAAPSEPTDDRSPKRLRLITAEQYLNSLAYIFGPDVKNLTTHLPPMPRKDGLLEVGSASVGVTDGQLEQYQNAAAAVAAQVISPANRNFLIPCKPAADSSADAVCASQFFKYIGLRLYRRPLTEEKLSEFVAAAGKDADRLKDFYAGLGITLETMLVSANTLYIIDTSEPDPRHPGHERLDAYSLASRLSFFLWNAAPDDELLKAAANGELQNDKGRARQVDRMLTSPRLADGMRSFFDDMFAFDDFNTLAKDPTIYTSFTGVTAEDAREQTLRTVIDHLITRNRDYRDLFTTRDTFISPSLATLYKLPAPSGWTAYEFPVDSPRAGLLTQVSFLAVHSHPGRSSPTKRGKALRELLLCEPVPSPPANVDFSLLNDPKSSYRTARERLSAHRDNPVCAGCHKITDPMGLALESFDGAGQYRETENDAAIDTSGSLDGAEFKDAAGLGRALHDNPALTSCLVKRLYAYGVGGPTSPETQPALDYLNGRFAADNFRLPALLRTIALSSAFSDVTDTQSSPVKAAEKTPRDAAAASK